MIDLATETVLPLSHVPKLPFIPRRRGRVHTATVYRWAQRGSGGVKLETVKTPGGLITTEQAVIRFFESLSGIPRSESPQTHKATANAIGAARRELIARGC